MNEVQNRIDQIELQIAVEKAGDEHCGQWSLEGANVTRQFSGAYTIAEIEAVLRDMRNVQAAYNRVSR